MKLINIGNRGRNIYLFTRDSEGKQKILLDKNFYPFYFEPDSNGKFLSYDGIKLKKITCAHPSDIYKQKSAFSYASDIKYVNNYLIEKVDKIEPTRMKIFYLDIEVLCPEMPDIYNPKYPVSCITIYNNFSKEYKTFFLNDYLGSRDEKEKQLLTSFINYMKLEKPDIWLSWNVEFDYCYLHNRTKRFAEAISPVGFVRVGKGDNIFYPVGISIVDQKGLYEKLTLNKRRSYALDYIAQEDLGEEGWKKTRFDRDEDLDIVKYKNINDVKRMVKLEEKFDIISYFNEVRILSKCNWEELPQETIRKDGKFFKVSNNSKIIDAVLLQEAKVKGVIVPAKHPGEIEQYDGAFRECYAVGRFIEWGKFDLTGAYPQMIVDFCLDSINLTEEEINNIKILLTDRITKRETDTYYYKQNENALLPSLVKRLLVIKDKLKKELKTFVPETTEFKKAEIKYNAIKSIVNSAYGVTGNRFFRLYDKRIAESITFLVRDLLEYVRDRLEESGVKVMYIDTDCVFIDSKEDISDSLNDIVRKWGIKKYNNSKVSVKFEFEGYFTKILVLGKCHYYGYLMTKKGLKKEIRGVEIKRSSSSKYEAYFQETLIEKILDLDPITNTWKTDRKDINFWVKKEKERIKTLDLLEVGFPAKIPQGELKNYPIHIRSYDNSRIIEKSFKLERGEIFYYTFIKSLGIAESGKDMDVLAFTDEHNDFINKKRINWSSIIERSIDGKANKIFEAISWKMKGQPMATNILF